MGGRYWIEEVCAGGFSGSGVLRRGYGFCKEGIYSRGRAAYIQGAARDGERRERDDFQPRREARGFQRGARFYRRAAQRAGRRPPDSVIF